MSDNDIQPDNGTDPPETDPPQGNPGNAEAARRRHLQKAAEDERDAVKLVADAQSTVIDQLRAQLVEQDCRAHVAPSAMPDFLARLNMTEVTNDQGGVDYAKLAQNRDAILEANSHLRAPDPRMPLAAPAANVSDSTSPYSTPGGGEVSWGDVLGAAARGEA